MSSTVSTACHQCKNKVTLEEAAAELPMACPSCGTEFIPAVAIKESDEKFAFWMYVAMGLVGVGLLIYGVATGQLKPPNNNADPAPAAAEMEPAEG